MLSFDVMPNNWNYLVSKIYQLESIKIFSTAENLNFSFFKQITLLGKIKNLEIHRCNFVDNKHSLIPIEEVVELEIYLFVSFLSFLVTLIFNFLDITVLVFNVLHKQLKKLLKYSETKI